MKNVPVCVPVDAFVVACAEGHRRCRLGKGFFFLSFGVTSARRGGAVADELKDVMAVMACDGAWHVMG